ncbi:MAG: DUF2771 domain-containing protein [Gordonia sp.]|nr:DUF2771 domain-containing protein [Gordonia sp. (in: high G+C Gram-positive bacteria)]
MRLSSGEKKFFAIFSIVAVLFVVVVASSVAVLASGHEADDTPYVQVASGDKLVRVEPLKYCSIDLQNCNQEALDPPARVPVKVGDTVMLSLSAELAVGPWTLVVQYLTAEGSDIGDEVFYPSDSARTITLDSTRDRILAAIEIKQPSQVEDEFGFVPRGIWGIDTLPDGVEVPAPSQ